MVVEVDGVNVEVNVDGDEEVRNQVVERLPELVRAARAAVTGGGFGDSQLYASHHLAELTAADWRSVGKEPPADVEGLLAMLVPISVWGDPEEGVTLDLSVGEDLTNYVLGVSFDADWAVSDVAMES